MHLAARHGHVCSKDPPELTSEWSPGILLPSNHSNAELKGGKIRFLLALETPAVMTRLLHTAHGLGQSWRGASLNTGRGRIQALVLLCCAASAPSVEEERVWGGPFGTPALPACLPGRAGDAAALRGDELLCRQSDVSHLPLFMEQNDSHGTTPDFLSI